MYDCLVVGSGPSGALTAYFLANSGLRTAILEKAALPRYKPCGGGLPHKTIQAIPFDIRPVLEVEARGGRVIFQGKTALQTDFEKSYGWLVMRDHFDYYLVEKARAAGVEVITGTVLTSVQQDDRQVIAVTNKGKFSGRILVGADGVNSRVSHNMGLLPARQTGTALEAEIEVPPHSLLEQGPYVTFDFGAIPGGYGWIFPKHDHLSVGVFHANLAKVPGLRTGLEQFMDLLPVLEHRKMLNLRGHPIHLGSGAGILHKGRVLLVGDAANLADAWIGEGIYYALQSARIAGEVIKAAFLDGSMDLSDYSHQIRKNIGSQLAVARTFARLVYWKPELATRLLADSRCLQGLLFSAIRGDISLVEFNRRVWPQSPYIILEAVSRRKNG